MRLPASSSLDQIPYSPNLNRGMLLPLEMEGVEGDQGAETGKAGLRPPRVTIDTLGMKRIRLMSADGVEEVAE